MYKSDLLWPENLQGKMNHAKSSARKRAKTAALTACLSMSLVICCRMNITPVQMVHTKPCASLKSQVIN